MAETSGFFDAEELVDGGYDREYVAEQWADYFKLFINNGVFVTPTNQLKVQATSGMAVQVLPGWAWINGYWYHNSSNLSITIPANISSGTVRHGIFVRFDGSNRQISIVLGNGRTEVNRTAPYYELKLAEIAVASGTTAIDQSMITDTRANNSVCGFVTGVVDVITTEDLFNQFTSIFNNWLSEVQAEQEEKSSDFDEWMATEKSDFENWESTTKSGFENWENTTKTDFETWQTNTKDTYENWEAFQESEFESWFDAIKGQLSQDAAGALQNQITLIDGTIANIEYTSSASRAYAVGECILYNSAFYTVSATVAQDDTWDTDINIAPMPKITDSLRAQAAAISQLVSDVSTALSTKADKVANPTSGNFASLDANGNLVDSGKKPSDFTTHQDVSGKMNINGSNADLYLDFTNFAASGRGLRTVNFGFPATTLAYQAVTGSSALAMSLPTDDDWTYYVGQYTSSDVISAADCVVVTKEEFLAAESGHVFGTISNANNQAPVDIYKGNSENSIYIKKTDPSDSRTGSFNYGYTTSSNLPYATAFGSVNMGKSCHSSGAFSVAQGMNSYSSGKASHSEGYNTKASGQYSHSEGNTTTASGQGAHAEGNNTTASGNYSHAGGNGATASQECSFVQGGGPAIDYGISGAGSSVPLFGISPRPKAITADTSTYGASHNGYSGYISNTATAMLGLSYGGGVYLLFCVSYTTSTGAVYGATTRMITASGSFNGTPTNVSLGQTTNAPATISMSANNEVYIKNTAASRRTLFHLIRIL